MKYQEMQQMKKILKMQLDMLTKMEDFIKFDEEYVKDHPEEILPPIVNSGVLKSHFITQKKACEGFLSYIARHSPRMKKEHDLANKSKVNISKTEPVKVLSKKVPLVDIANIANVQVNNPQFMSLF